MRKTILCTLALFGALALGTAEARAQASSGSGLGVGVEATITGLNGPAIVYQAPQFHIDGVIGVNSLGLGGGDNFLIAGRFFYEIHSGELSDFSLGGGIGIINFDNDPGDDDADLHFEAGAQIRAFLAPNVALSTSLGLGFVVDEGDDDFGILGQLTGAMGVTYFFF